MNLARPVQPEFETDGLVLDLLDGLFIEIDEPEVVGDRGAEMQRDPGTPVVSDGFDPFEEIRLENPHQTDQCQHAGGNQDGSLFEAVQLHAGELNKKTRATQGCSGLKR